MTASAISCGAFSCWGLLVPEVGVSHGATLSVAPVDDQHGASRVGRDGLCDAADQHAGEAGAAVGAEHDQACVVLIGELDDPLPGGRRLGCCAACVESCLLRQRGSLSCGSLGRL